MYSWNALGLYILVRTNRKEAMEIQISIISMPFSYWKYISMHSVTGMLWWVGLHLSKVERTQFDWRTTFEFFPSRTQAHIRNTFESRVHCMNWMRRQWQWKKERTGNEQEDCTGTWDAARMVVCVRVCVSTGLCSMYIVRPARNMWTSNDT